MRVSQVPCPIKYNYAKWGGGMGGNVQRTLQDILYLDVRKMMKHVVMQGIGHYRLQCDWPKQTMKRL